LLNVSNYAQRNIVIRTRDLSTVEESDAARVAWFVLEPERRPRRGRSSSRKERKRPMNRCQFAIAIVAGYIASFRSTQAANVPPVEFDAEDYAAVRYMADSDSAVRSVSARVSLWRDAESAEAHRQFIISGAGSDLPDGEFYQSEPVEYPLPADLASLPATAMTWNTTVGVVAYRTEWVLLTARRQTIVWDLWFSGAEPEPVQDLAVSLAEDLTGREHAPGSDLARLLPGPDQIPEGLDLEYRMSPDGTFDAQGTPVPDASPGP